LSNYIAEGLADLFFQHLFGLAKFVDLVIGFFEPMTVDIVAISFSFCQGFSE